MAIPCLVVPRALPCCAVMHSCTAFGVPSAAFSDFKHLAPMATVKVSYTDRMVRGPSAWIHWAFADCNAIAIFAWCLAYGRHEPRLTSLGPSLYRLEAWAKARDTRLTRQGPAKKERPGGGGSNFDALYSPRPFKIDTRKKRPYTPLMKINKDGYFEHGKKKKGATTLIHRKVMEAHLGRKLLATEHVHHKNHDKLDNRLENLELMTSIEHMKEHYEFYDEEDKKCTRCKIIKKRTEFGKNPGGSSGSRRSRCKTCCNIIRADIRKLRRTT